MIGKNPIVLVSYHSRSSRSYSRHPIHCPPLVCVRLCVCVCACLFCVLGLSPPTPSPLILLVRMPCGRRWPKEKSLAQKYQTEHKYLQRNQWQYRYAVALVEVEIEVE